MPDPVIAERIRALGPWFHNLHLPDGSETAPDHPLGDFPRCNWEAFALRLPGDLNGWTALDIGCNAGYYSFRLARRGAKVLGIDLDERYLQQARWAAEVYGLADRVRFERMQVYDLARRAERFDIVLFLGVFYHLRYPLLGLDVVRERTRLFMVFQTLMTRGRAPLPRTDGLGFEDLDTLEEPGWPRMAFVEHEFAGDPTNWWVPNPAGVDAMLRSAGFEVADAGGDPFLVCRPASQPSPHQQWNRSEYLAAIGTDWAGSADGKLAPNAGTIESGRGVRRARPTPRVAAEAGGAG